MAPGIVTSLDGKSKTLYMSTVASIEEATKHNLKKSLKGECDWKHCKVPCVDSPPPLTSVFIFG